MTKTKKVLASVLVVLILIGISAVFGVDKIDEMGRTLGFKSMAGTTIETENDFNHFGTIFFGKIIDLDYAVTFCFTAGAHMRKYRPKR